MELRKYDPGRDFEIIKNWIDDERTHASLLVRRLMKMDLQL